MLNKELLMMGDGKTPGTLTISYKSNAGSEYIHLKDVSTGKVVFSDNNVTLATETAIIPVKIGDQLLLETPPLFIASVYDMIGLDFNAGIFTVLENNASANINLLID